MRRLVSFVLVGLLGLAAVAAADDGHRPAFTRGDCLDQSDAAPSLDLVVDGEPAHGRWAAPSPQEVKAAAEAAGQAPTHPPRPRGLVVVAHGYSVDADMWAGDTPAELGEVDVEIHAELDVDGEMQQLASRLGALVVAMDYRETFVDDDGNVRGWAAHRGAADTNAAVRLLADTCGIDHVVLLGISMGGSVSALSLAEQPVRADGSPLYDHWVVGEGVTNLVQLGAVAYAARVAGDPLASRGADDMELTFGGSFAEVPATYLEASAVDLADRIAGAGLEGVVQVHGIDDLLVTLDQARQLAARLDGLGVVRETWTAARREDPDQYQVSITGTALGNHGLLTGHAHEMFEEHPIMATSYDRIESLLAGVGTDCTREYLVDLDANGRRFSTLLWSAC